MSIILTGKKKDKIFPSVKIGLPGTYRLVPIQSTRKGPLYTIIKESNYKKKRDHSISMEYEFLYNWFDCPVDQPVTMSVPNFDNQYLVQPLMAQLSQLNNFCEMCGDESYLSVGAIMIHIDNNQYVIDIDDDERAIRAICQKYGIETSVSDIFNLNDQILLIGDKGCIWIDDIGFEDILNLKHTFQYAVVPIDGTESVYLLTRNELITYLQIKYLSVSMLWNDKVHIMGFSTQYIQDILRACLFYPQLLLLEDALFHSTPGYQLSIDTHQNICDAKLTITSTELQSDDPGAVNMFYVIKHFVNYITDVL